MSSDSVVLTPAFLPKIGVFFYHAVRRLQIPAAGLLMIFSASPGQENPPDSSKTVELPGIIVSATRSPVALDDSPSKVDLYTSDQLRLANATSVADIVETTGSIFLTDLGTYGALKTASIRGSAPEEVLVLLNGNRVNNFENGLADLSLLPVGNVERIEVLHGGNSAAFGAAALGGIVNIITRQPADTSRVRASAGLGSYSYQHYELEGSTHVAGIAVLGSYGSERGRDDYALDIGPADYPASLHELTLNRSNADFILRHAYVSGKIMAGSETDISIFGQQDIADRGVPGPFSYPVDTPLAREADNNVNVGIAITNRSLTSSTLSLHTGVQYNYETYIDPDPAFPMNSFYKNLFLNLNPQADILLSPTQHLTVGAEMGYAELHSSDFVSLPLRRQTALYATDEMEFGSDRQVASRIALFESLRLDDFSDAPAALTPKFGFNLLLLTGCDLHLRSSIGGSFRSPSFNDLYYPGASNPNLKPERSTSFDAGLTSQLHGLLSQRWEITYFLMNTTDQIIFDPVQFLPLNIGKVESRGVEISWNVTSPDDRFGAGVDYTFTSALNKTPGSDSTYDRQLIYRPKDILKCHASARLYPFVVSLMYAFTGERFTTATNSSSLPAYRVANANVLLNNPLMGIPLSFKAEVNNIFDTEYQIYARYPMPKRTLRFTLSYEPL